MKVADLQEMLGVLQQILASAGAAPKGKELAEFIAALEPFRNLNAKQLAAELGKKVQPGKLLPAEFDALVVEIRALYERAGHPTTTLAEVEEKTKPLFGLKQKKDVLRAAQAIGLNGMDKKTIPVIAREIKKRIEDRMGSAQKTGMMNI